MLAGLVLGISVLESRFIQPANLRNVLLQMSMDGIVACGLTLVILLGGLDLSVGAVTALSGVLFVIALPLGIVSPVCWPCWQEPAWDSSTELLIGKIKLNSLIVTLGTMAAVQGAAFWLSRGNPIPGPGGDFEMLGGGFLALYSVAYRVFRPRRRGWAYPAATHPVWKGPVRHRRQS